MIEEAPDTERAEQPGRWDVRDILAALGRPAIGLGDDPLPVGPAVIDAREVQPGGMFVALQGTRGHGLAHFDQARERGAACVLVGNDAPAEMLALVSAELRTGDPFLVEADVDGVTALGQVARAWRRRCSFAVVGVTGSSGKTSTKDMLAAILRPIRRVVASHANHNNEIGVPLTLLGAPAHTDVVICEMGMRGLGQIAYLCDIAEPDVGIVTNAGTAHLELLGSEENIARAKAEIIAGVRPDGVAIVPATQPELLEYAARRPGRTWTFSALTDSMSPAANVYAAAVTRTPTGLAGTIRMADNGAEIEFSLPVHGLHQGRNLAAATAAARALVENQEELSNAFAGLDWSTLTRGRGDRHRLRNDILLIDDAYNANPESMRAAITELEAIEAPRRVAVLGYMAELGPTSAQLHRSLGELVAASQIDALVVVETAPEAREFTYEFESVRDAEVPTYPTAEAAAQRAQEWLQPGDAVLVKGSNSAGLGRLVDILVERLGVQAAQEMPSA